MTDRSPKMIPTMQAGYYINLDKELSHYGWVMKWHPDGKYISWRLATPAEQQYATTLLNWAESRGVTLSDHPEQPPAVELLSRQLTKAREEIARLEGLAYYPGSATCDECGFSRISKNLNTHTGSVTTAEFRPEACPNDGTMMRRTTERETNEGLEKAFGQLLDEFRVAKAALETISNLPIPDQDDMPSANMRILAKKALQSIAEGVKNEQG